MTEPFNNPKALLLTQLLATNSDVFVLLRPDSDCMLPAHLMQEEHISLQLGYSLYPIPMRDLHVGEGGFTVTLSFNRAPWHCQVLWSAVFGMMTRTGIGRVWTEDMPAKLRASTEPLPVPSSESQTLAAPKIRKGIPPLPQRFLGSPKSVSKRLPLGWRIFEGGRRGPQTGGAA